MTSPFSQPPIVCSVFCYLSAKELDASAQVCRLWNDLAEAEKRRRKEITWTFFPEHRINYCCFKSSGFKLDLNPSSEPSFALVLCAQRPFEVNHDCGCTGKRKRGTDAEEHVKSETMETTFQKALPKKCVIGFVRADGIIGTYPDNSTTKVIRNKESLTVVYFPNLPGVKIYNFPLTGFPIPKAFDVIDQTGVPSGVPIKLLLLFQKEYSWRFCCASVNPVVDYVIEQEGCVAVGGVFVRHTSFPNNVVKRQNTSCGIAFTGDNVVAGSIIDDIYVVAQEGVESKLKSFGESGILQGQCIAFMFTSASQIISEMISNLFRNMYPKVPIFGVFGDAAFGFDYFPGYTKPKQTGLLYRKDPIIFAVLSIRNP